ncbi:MAG: TonB-dependent receptor [Pseudomonadota bacterium]
MKKSEMLKCGVATLAILTCPSVAVASTGVEGLQLQAAETAPSEEAADTDDKNLVIVTGEKRERSVQDTQSSIVVVTRDDIESTYTPNLEQLLDRIPNVNSAFGDAGFTIRGIAQNGVDAGLNTISSNLTLTVNIDDIPLTTTQQNLLSPTGAWDLNRIEVFRGPQSTVQGRNALAGAILLYSQDPGYEFTADAQAVFANFDTRQYSAAVGGPIIEDVLAFRISYDHQEADGFVFNPTLDSDEVAGNNDELARLKLLFQPTGNLSVKLTGIYADSVGTVFQGFELDTFEATGERVNSLDSPQRRFDESWLFGSRIDWDPSDTVSLSSITSYVDSESGRNQDGDGTSQPLGFFTQDNEIESFTQELRAVFTPADDWNVLLGGFYANIDAATAVVGEFPGFIFGAAPDSIINIVSNTDEATENFAFFGEVEWQATDNLRLLLGLRYDNETVRVATSSATIITPGPTLTNPDTLADTEFDAFLPKAQIVYDFNDRISAGFTYSRGYRSGGAEQNVLGNTITFDAEFINNYEFSLRTSFLDGRITLNANAFYLDWTDQQVQVPLLAAFPELAGQIPDGLDPSTLFATVNAGQSELYGFEGELVIVLTDTLRLNGALGYNRTEFLDFPVGDGTNLAGNQFRFSPELSGSLGAQFEHPSGIFANANVNYQNGQFSDNLNLPGQFSESFAVVNARIGYQYEKFSISVFANNAFGNDFTTFVNPQFNQGQGGTEGVYGVQIRAGF